MNELLQKDEADPQVVGRYRIDRVLGEGATGRVFLAQDDQLQRAVAVKVPRAERMTRPEDAVAYLKEARTVASLDHPNIVPTYDVGTTPEGHCFVVSKFIEGTDLSLRIRQTRFTFAEAARLIATVAEAIHYAHRKGVVHRDIKSANILLDPTNKPYITDFGLALKEEDFGKGVTFAGTPGYMSPEQARGEGHRVDGRTDIYSLGVVLYELMIGERPFKADSLEKLLEQITSVEPKPPRQIVDQIPKELERICLKALSKRASDRYTTAKDMADDLTHFLASPQSKAVPQLKLPPEAPIPSDSGGRSAVASGLSTDTHPIKIIPKGLRSFDARESDFFLELLPGPRDREGLPESIRFWKSRIEETDAEHTFSVGLIYGPSGCGKSSMVKAGLLPRLSGDVIAVYVEAAAEETETRLLNGLRKRCTDVPANLGLKDTFTALRRGHGNRGKKVVIVIDQFEQWLHAKTVDQNSELVQAFRQCDGSVLQGVIMVRDDFWMAATLFMRQLEVRLLEGQNSAAVDLFDLDHSKKVLAAFGRAFGKFSADPRDLTKEQKGFLNQAVSGLAQDGKVVSIRLALFAEMIKNRPWTPATLKEVGGTEGVGVLFLEETFSAASALPERRYHQKAARLILQALLPQAGSNLKGHMRSSGELLQIAGLRDRPGDFEDLIRILDSEIRLITPIDPEGKDNSSASIHLGEKFYQLTHDYLVPSLRTWLTSKMKETRKGRTELLLADRSAEWNARPEIRRLPSFREWLTIRWWTDRARWTPPQRKFMKRAGRFHVIQGLIIAALLATTFATIRVIRLEYANERNATHAQGLVERLLHADTPNVPRVLQEMTAYRRWVNPLLHEEFHKADAGSTRKLHAGIALMSVDPNKVSNFVYDSLLKAEHDEVAVVRDALEQHKQHYVDRLWVVAEMPEKGKESQRLRAAAALAKYDPDNPKWSKVQEHVSNDLVSVPVVYLKFWVDALRPVRFKLVGPLCTVHCHAERRDADRALATDILDDYAGDRPDILADLLMSSDDWQFAAHFPKVKAHEKQAIAIFLQELDRTLPSDAGDDAKERLAKRQANAAVALLKLDQPKQAWRLLKHGPDPRVRSYLIHRLRPMGADIHTIVERFDVETDLSTRRALILMLGEARDKITPKDSKLLLPKLQEIYRTAPDPGLHAAVEWLLSRWKQEEWLKSVNDQWAQDEQQRKQRLTAIKELLDSGKEKSPQWYVNGQGQTMVVVPGPVQFIMGSPAAEVGRYEASDYPTEEMQHEVRIGRSFALASKSVTVEQFRKFSKNHRVPEKCTRVPNLPVVGITWYQAAAYCNWLSKAEGLDKSQWCYETDQKGHVAKLKKNYLSLSGYRLPTEAEMEYATRAGALTARYYGETEELLGKYAWYQKNSSDQTWPVGSLKPNDLGLFDSLGNVYTWCQESYKEYPSLNKGEVAEDREDDLDIVATTGRILRGGSFVRHSSSVRSADRLGVVPGSRFAHYGLRVARTIDP